VHAFAERLHEAHGKPRPPAGGRRDAAKPKSRSARR
jgi:hypothetical protein